MKHTKGGKERKKAAAAASFWYIHHKEYVTEELFLYAIMVLCIILHIIAICVCMHAPGVITFRHNI